MPLGVSRHKEVVCVHVKTIDVNCSLSQLLSLARAGFNQEAVSGGRDHGSFPSFLQGGCHWSVMLGSMVGGQGIWRDLGAACCSGVGLVGSHVREALRKLGVETDQESHGLSTELYLELQGALGQAHGLSSGSCRVALCATLGRPHLPLGKGQSRLVAPEGCEVSPQCVGDYHSQLWCGEALGIRYLNVDALLRSPFISGTVCAMSPNYKTGVPALVFCLVGFAL